MWHLLEEEIRFLCQKKLANQRRRVSGRVEEYERRSRQSTAPIPVPTTDTPTIWSTNPDLDPASVLRRSASLAHGIQRAVHAGTYTPRQPVGIEVAKSDGKKRLVTCFGIPDEAVSRLLYQSLTAKNRSLFGAHSYGYREGVGIYDALHYAFSRWRANARLFVAEYDFKSYFDSIGHDFLKTVLENHPIHATRTERHIIEKFMISPLATIPGIPPEHRSRGIPQGTTISLFLANLALLPLDETLEGVGVQFTRYADDLLVWSTSYEKISSAVDSLHEWSSRSGVAINNDKSTGVRILTRSDRPAAEFRSINSVDYLGHRLRLDRVTPKPSRMAKIRRDILEKIFLTLLREPLRATQDMSRLKNGLDRDYVSLIWQLRRFLYGRLTENQIDRLMKGVIPRTGLTGVVAQFPMVSDFQDFAELDRWLRHRVWLALRRRAALLGPHLAEAAPRLWTLPVSGLVTASEVSRRTGQTIDLRLPSTERMAGLVARAIRQHGPSVVRSSSRLYLDA